MMITSVETFVVDAGWRPWLFVKVATDDGLIGYGECSDCWSPQPHGIVGTVDDLTPLLVGKDPRATERLVWDLAYSTRQSPGGIAAKAIAGIECALVDIKAKALGISVVELFGGPMRDRIRLYWSHCGTTRARYAEHIGEPAIETLADITTLGREVVQRGFTALKTNIVIPREQSQAGFGELAGLGSEVLGTDQSVTTPLLRHIEQLIGTFRDAVGPDVDINLDLNFLFKPESTTRIAKVVEPYNLLWLEVDMYDPTSIRQIKDATTTKICTGENLFHPREYLPYFNQRAADIFMVDVPWNGFSQSKQIGNLAEIYQFNVAPHNYYSHLASYVSASLCGVLPNVRIMEIDIDDVPWKDDLVTNQPEIIDGYLTVPQGLGWGTDLNEEVARAHRWDI